MRLLCDTHLLIWAADNSRFLPKAAREILNDPENDLFFSAISIWEVAIKNGLQQAGFNVQPRALRRGLVENGYSELAFSSEHAFAVTSLPPLHKDPFDRALIAQASTEGIYLLTADQMLEAYSDLVRTV
jgi:PIN domain nuclease of toxin-antitoxin system